jgi:hypothetical protein
MFGNVESMVLKSDYCNWELTDPAVNFAISRRGAKPGVDHIGIQVENDAELAGMNARFTAARLLVYRIGSNRDNVLLRQVGQGVDGRSAGGRIGDVLNARSCTDLWRVAQSSAGTRAINGRMLLADHRIHPEPHVSVKPYSILILCTGNSSCSIMAEALFNVLGKGRGRHPTQQALPHCRRPFRRLLRLKFSYPAPVFVRSPLGTTGLLPQDVRPLAQMLIKGTMPVFVRAPVRAAVLFP